MGKKLMPFAEAALLKLQQVMTAGGYSPRSIGNYVREMRFIFEYYPDTKSSAITANRVEKYICYIKQVFKTQPPTNDTESLTIIKSSLF